MTDTIKATLAGALSGTTRTGALTPVPFTTTLLDQDAHVQMTVTVEPADVDKLVCFPQNQGPAGTQQTLFMIQSDIAIQIKLNADTSLVFNLEPVAPFTLPGQPEINQVEFTGIGATTASVSVTKIIGDGTVPGIGGGGTGATGYTLQPFVATVGQTVFTLTTAPADPDDTLLFVEGVQYSAPTFFTLSGTTLTWLDVPYTLPAGARVEVFYR